MAIERFLQRAKEIEQQGKSPKKKSLTPHAEAHDESNWLIAYADMMTLLCIFFVLMFSIASLKKPKFERIRQEMAKHFGGDFKSANEELARWVTNVIQEMGIEKEAVVSSDATGVSLVLKASLAFDGGTAELTERGRQVIEKVIQTISERQKAELKQYKIIVEGHTDSRPITSGVYPSNWELSSARAIRIVRMFLARGFEAGQFVPIGLADSRPKVPDRAPSGELDEEAMAKNRRVVIRVFEPYVDTVPWENAAFSEEAANSAY